MALESQGITYLFVKFLSLSVYFNGNIRRDIIRSSALWEVQENF